ncbi:hypothetical protein CQ010_01580 [Arthrobacter sp. MYb211]|uniref:hypothetical protein n=1 Tax=unclassified Arthrobacter TaxID=235627 RepID=UPI000CFBA2B2|nr:MULTISPECIES: hypothetical protein [unclassified Arthrobacter]PRA13365.1 hypothetical protein CQ015_03835 [Arthrobacter sp. MYb221]PRC10562.1 hypothetical protein CQ010_01580 [Arthrobacter sp. MYb211]
MEQVQVPIQQIISKLTAQIGELTYEKIAANAVAEQYQGQLMKAQARIAELEAEQEKGKEG